MHRGYVAVDITVVLGRFSPKTMGKDVLDSKHSN